MAPLRRKSGVCDAKPATQLHPCASLHSATRSNFDATSSLQGGGRYVTPRPDAGAGDSFGPPGQSRPTAREHIGLGQR